MSQTNTSVWERWADAHISSPFIRYYSISFICVHWRIWLYLGDGTLSTDKKIKAIQDITTHNVCTAIINHVGMFLYMIFIPLVFSILGLWILRLAEKITAPWHEKHRIQVKQKVDTAQNAEHAKDLEYKYNIAKNKIKDYHDKLNAINDIQVNDLFIFLILKTLIIEPNTATYAFTEKCLEAYKDQHDCDERFKAKLNEHIIFADVHGYTTLEEDHYLILSNKGVDKFMELAKKIGELPENYVDEYFMNP